MRIYGLTTDQQPVCQAAAEAPNQRSIQQRTGRMRRIRYHCYAVLYRTAAGHSTNVTSEGAQTHYKGGFCLTVPDVGNKLC